MSGAGGLHRLVLASGNPGKLKEYQVLASGHALKLQLMPGFAAIPEFPENAPTFAENAAGKALYYSKHSLDPVFAAYAVDRQMGERLGDFTIRAGFVAATGNGRDFHANIGAPRAAE